MISHDWKRLHSLLDEALEMTAGERAVFLEEQCGADRPLREALERLLAEHERLTGVLDRPLFSPPVEAEEDVWAGRVLNSRYRIERFIARGGMSTVYLARDEQLAGRPVIVKFLHAWARQYSWLKSKFRREMEALARIDHHAVVGVLDSGETADGLPFLVIEYIHGVTLRSEMADGPMAAERAARIIREIGRAVGAAHSKGVLHRDLKPENIMLELPGTAEERVRLIDFGIARLEEAAGALATELTQFAGTTPYMAPEQLRGKPCPASDVYAAAVVAFELLAGERPFSAASPVEMYEQQRAGAKARALLRHGVPEPAARLIVKQLSFGPEDRGADAVESAEQIANALLHPDGQIRRRRHVLGALAGGAIAALGGGYMWRSRRTASLNASERVIELPAASEPLEHGFQARGIIDNHVIPNADATGFESLRITSSDQGGYYHLLNEAQADAANHRGWKMMFEAAAEEGSIAAAVDVPHASARYAVNMVATPGGPDMVRLLTGFTPAIHGIDEMLPGPAGRRHRYLLALPPGSATAELWVDGVRHYSGYSGLQEYRYYRGPEMDVARYRSARAAGVFWSFRFEIG
jgi:tRNA A-37 threonylcarbamoyl transferase component Bud32